jgi:hypothetical protein
MDGGGREFSGMEGRRKRVFRKGSRSFKEWKENEESFQKGNRSFQELKEDEESFQKGK